MLGSTLATIALAACGGAEVATQEAVVSFVRFVDVDSGAEVPSDSVTCNADVALLERADTSSARTANWRVVWPAEEHPALSVLGWDVISSFPRSADHAKPDHFALVLLRRRARAELTISDGGAALSMLTHFAQRSVCDLDHLGVPALDRERHRDERSDTLEPARSSERAQSTWRVLTGMCSLGTQVLAEHTRNSVPTGRRVDVWVATPSFARAFQQVHQQHWPSIASLPSTDLPRYAGAFFTPVGTAVQWNVALAAPVRLAGRVDARGAPLPSALSIQLSIADEPFARAPRMAIPESPGTRAAVGLDGSFVFERIPRGPYWIGAVRGGEVVAPFARFDVESATDSVLVGLETIAAATSARRPRTTDASGSDIARAWVAPAGAGPVRTVTFSGPAASDELTAYSLRAWKGVVPESSELSASHAILRSESERIAVVDIAAARASNVDPSNWPLEWSVPARIWLAWYGGAPTDLRAARFDVRANGVLVERCWLEPGDVRELTVPPGEIVVTTRPQDRQLREQRATLEARGHWIVRER